MMVSTPRTSQAAGLIQADDAVDAEAVNEPREFRAVQHRAAVEPQRAAEGLLQFPRPADVHERPPDRRDGRLALVDWNGLLDEPPLRRWVRRAVEGHADEIRQVRKPTFLAHIHVEDLRETVDQFFQLIERGCRNIQKGLQVAALVFDAIERRQQVDKCPLEIRGHYPALRMSRWTSPRTGISPRLSTTSTCGAYMRT